MQKRILITGIGLLSMCSSYAQNDIDAMRYSQITFGGTARFASMAGSMGALGGDISTLSFNPAGIAIFKKTELSISTAVFSQTTNSVYNANSSSDSKLNFNLGNIGFVASINLINEKNTTGWENLNFGFGYNRTNNFHNRMDIQGDNKSSSILDVFVANADGNTENNFDGFSTGLAWQAFLINPIVNDTNYYNHVVPNYGIKQRKLVETTGSMGETVISFGGNYKSKLYLGGTIGIVRTRYNEETTFEEIDEKDTIANFKKFTYGQNLATSGNGVNLKLGAIIRPNDWFRIGVAVHTPTTISLNDKYSSYMTSDLDGGITYDSIDSPDGEFNYRITTPFKAIGSVGFVIKKIGILNIDYEYLDYSTAQLHPQQSEPNVFSDVNTLIRSKYTNTGNLRVGGEVRLDPIAIRVGYALYGSPFKNNENKNASRSSYTAGIGYRHDNYFIDFAYVLTKYDEFNYLYDSPNATIVENSYKNSSFMLSLGLRF